MAHPTADDPRRILMHAYSKVVLTVDEFERLQSEVRGRVLAGDPGISDLILARMIEDNEGRYYEIKLNPWTEG